MRKSIKVLYLSYDGLTDSLGRSQILSYQTKLAEKGCDITIVSFDKPDVYENERAGIQQMVDEAGIKWVSLPYTKSPPVVSTIKDIRAGWKAIKQVQKEKNFDIVHCRGYITAILGLRCQKHFGTKFLFDMRGWWADEKRESGLWNSPLFLPVYRYFKHLEKRYFVESDLSISLTEVGKREIVKLGYKEADKIGMIPTCVDFDRFTKFSAAKRSSVREELNIDEDAKVLLYSGSLGGNYANEELFKLFALWKEKYADGILLLLTKAGEQYVFDEAKKHNADIASIRVKAVPFTEMSTYLMAGNVGVVLYKKTYSIIGRSPTKLGEYWASGLSAISVKGTGDLDVLAEKYPEGLSLMKEVNAREASSCFDGSLQNASDKTMLRQYALDYYDLKNGVDKYYSYYDMLAGDGVN